MGIFQVLTTGTTISNHHTQSLNVLRNDAVVGNAKQSQSEKGRSLNSPHSGNTIDDSVRECRALITDKDGKILKVKSVNSFADSLKTEPAYPQNKKRKYSDRIENKRIEETETAQLLPDEILQHVPFAIPTPVQSYSLPLILEDKSLLVCAPTGSGKTFAFLLPMLAKLSKLRRDSSDTKSQQDTLARGANSEADSLSMDDLSDEEDGDYDVANKTAEMETMLKPKECITPKRTSLKTQPNCVIMAPTKDLALQIWRECRRLSEDIRVVLRYAAIGMPDRISKRKAEWPVIDIGTPGTLSELYQGQIMERLCCIVCDEADKLLEPELIQQTRRVLDSASPEAQKLFFSATIPSHVESFVRASAPGSVRLIVGRKESVKREITQQLIYCGSEEGKLMAMRRLIGEGQIHPPVLVFVQSIERAKELMNELRFDSLHVDVIHSDIDQSRRNRVLNRVRQGKTWMLVCTELLSRGIDIKGINMVINYDFPQTVSSYIHRVGRTARANRHGRAITLYTREDAKYLRLIVNVMRNSGCKIPNWMLNVHAASKDERRSVRKHPVKRKSISTESLYDRQKRARKLQMIKKSKERMLKKATSEKKNVISKIQHQS